MTEEQTVRGLDYLIRLSYAATDRSAADFSHKRNLLWSLYCFRCLFDSAELKRLSPVLVKYGCSFTTDAARAAGFDNVIEMEEEGKTLHKFDAGSPLFADMVAKGELTGPSASVPEKSTLYEMVLAAVTLDTATDELKAMWYLYFPFIPLIGAPHEHDLYLTLKELLLTEPVFAKALASEYADSVYCSTAELTDEPPVLIDWYTPFIEWKCERTSKGVSRETEKLQKKLALGDYAYVLVRSEQMLDCFPDDEEILLLNVAARMSLCGKADFEDRVRLLADNFRIINEAITGGAKKYVYFLYYRGLTRLGMQDIDNAVADFRACLETDPHFELAQMMLRGIEKMDEKHSS